MNIRGPFGVAATIALLPAGACRTDATAPAAVLARDSIAGYDQAFSPLHYVDGAGRLYELMLQLDDDGSVGAVACVVDGVLFATIGKGADPAGRAVTLYDGGRQAFSAIVAADGAQPLQGWPAFAAAATDAQQALHAWQSSATGGALAGMYAALGRLVAAAGVLVPSARPGP